MTATPPLSILLTCQNVSLLGQEDGGAANDSEVNPRVLVDNPADAIIIFKVYVGVAAKHARNARVIAEKVRTEGGYN